MENSILMVSGPGTMEKAGFRQIFGAGKIMGKFGKITGSWLRLGTPAFHKEFDFFQKNQKKSKLFSR